MGIDFTTNRGCRLLLLHERLIRGEAVRKKDLAEEFGVSLKTIQRDFDDLRAYFADHRTSHEGAAIPYIGQGAAGDTLIRYRKDQDDYVLERVGQDADREELLLIRIGRVLYGKEQLAEEEADQILRQLLTMVPVKKRAVVMRKVKKD